MSAEVAIFLLLVVLGAVLVVAGVLVLFGPGWAMIAAGIVCGLAAAFVKAGMLDG